MPIEFQCSSCSKLLRVPETAIGKQAKCPSCQQVVTVPAASTTGTSAPLGPPPVGPPASPVGPPAGPPAVGADPYGANPYAGAGTPLPPSNPYATPTTAPTPPLSITPGTGRLEASRAVSTAWMLFKENIGVLIGCFVVINVVAQLMSFIQQISQIGLLQAAGPPGPGGLNQTQTIILIVSTLGFSLLAQLAQSFLWIGLIRVHLAIARGQRVDFGMLFSGGRWLLRIFLGNLLFGIAFLLGFIALIVPGIFLVLRYWSFQHFIVDKDCGIMESFKLAGQASKNNLGETFLLGLIGIGLSILGVIMLCFGLLVTGPVVYLSMTIGYLMMTGQQFRQQARF